MLETNDHARDVLQIASMVKHIDTIEDYWVDCKDEFESRVRAFARLTVEQIKFYKVDINVEDIEDYGHNMFSTTYLTKIRCTHIRSEPFVDSVENLDILMAKIIKRTGKWIEWTCA